MFERVIGSSGSALADWGHYTVTEGARRARLLADAVGCDSTQNDSLLISCLQQTNITAIVNNQDITLSDAVSSLLVGDNHQKHYSSPVSKVFVNINNVIFLVNSFVVKTAVM